MVGKRFMDERIRELKFGILYISAAIAVVLLWVVICFAGVIPILEKLISENVDPLFENDSEYRLEEIENLIGSKIPKDAGNIEYSSKRGHGFFIRLSFKAPPGSALQFANSLCGGILYQGYDPFNAVESPLKHGAHLIQSTNFVYYSYSRDAPTTYWGNRCRGGGHVQLIRVDQSDPDFYTILFERLGSPDMSTSSVPLPTWGSLNHTMPIPNLPLITPGIALVEDDYVLITEEFCVEMRYDDMSEFESPYRYLIGADVEITLDAQLIVSTYITDRGILAPKDYDGESPVGPFNYCFFEDWDSGSHAVVIRVEPVGQTAAEYSWIFRVIP